MRISKATLDGINAGEKEAKEEAPDEPQRYADLFGSPLKHHGRRFKVCREVVGTVEPGETLRIISRGEFDIEHILAMVIDDIGPCDVHLACWKIAQAPAARIVQARKHGWIRRVRLVIDPRGALFSAGVGGLQTITRATGPSGVAKPASHAKVYLAGNDDRAVSIISSGNLNGNPRIENTILIDGRAVYDFHRSWMEEVIAHRDPFEGGKGLWRHTQTKGKKRGATKAEKGIADAMKT
jgi:hypothetical protein